MSKITLKEIGKALNLSVSTVSRALRDSYEIGEKTKERVLEYAKSVHYRPNPIAQSLKVNKSHSICVIIPEIANNFFSEVINGIDYAAYERGYNVFIFQTHESYEREVSSIHLGMDRRVDGFIMSLSGKTDHYDHLDLLKSEEIPIVYFDRVPPANNINKVVVNNFEGAYNGTKQLINKGKKKIAHITTPLILSITKERLEGYKSCLRDHDIEIDEALIKFCSFDHREAIDIVNKLVYEDQIDALFLGSDRLALNALNAVKKLGTSMQNKIEIVGFTNMKYVDLLSPVICAIYQPALEIGHAAANLLIDYIEARRKPEPKQIVLKTFMKTND